MGRVLRVLSDSNHDRAVGGAAVTYQRWAIFLAVCLASFLIFELWAYFSEAPTLSQTIWAATDWAEPLPLVVAYAFGLLCGHLWFPRRTVVLVDSNSGFDAKALKALEQALEYDGRRPPI